MGIINGVAVFAGSMTGGFLERGLPEVFTLTTLDGKVTSSLLILFVLSALLRMLAAYLFLNRFAEVREVEHTSSREIIIRIAHLRPLHGITFRPVNLAIKKTISQAKKVKDRVGENGKKNRKT